MQVIVNEVQLSRFVDQPELACALEDLHYDRDELELELHTLDPEQDWRAEELDEAIMELDRREQKMLATGAVS